MSKENRKAMYDKLVKEDRLDKDDGALVKEFGKPWPDEVPYTPPLKKIKKAVKK